MVTITLGNSYSSVANLPAKDTTALKTELSYVVGGKNAYFSRFGPRKRSLLGKRGDFPTGLVGKVKQFLKARNIVYYVKDARTKPLNLVKFNLDLGALQPYKDQLDAVNTAELKHRGGVVMPTGSGKSVAMALLIARMKVKTLVIVPNLELKKQLSESFKKFFGSLKYVTVENIDSKNLTKVSNYDMLILDECHHSAARTYQKLNKICWKNIYYRFFFTGTFFRNDEQESLLLESIVGEPIHELSYETAVKNGYVVPVEAYYFTVPTQSTDSYTYRQVYSELVVHNETRNTIIANLLELLRLNDVYTLVLVREVAHGKILSALSSVPFVSGEDDESRNYITLFNNGTIKQLIGTTGVIGEGVDTKPCEYVIIAGSGKAKSQFMQQVGRAVRRYETKESAKVIIFKDKSHKFLTRHFNTQRKILLDEYSVNVLELDI